MVGHVDLSFFSFNCEHSMQIPHCLPAKFPQLGIIYLLIKWVQVTGMLSIKIVYHKWIESQDQHVRVLIAY